MQAWIECFLLPLNELFSGSLEIPLRSLRTDRRSDKRGLRRRSTWARAGRSQRLLHPFLETSSSISNRLLSFLLLFCLFWRLIAFDYLLRKGVLCGRHRYSAICPGAGAAAEG
jgi:hypothetical protein